MPDNLPVTNAFGLYELEFDRTYDTNLLKELSGITQPWGSGAGSQPGTTRIMFKNDPAIFEAVQIALEAHDQTVLSRAVMSRLEEMAAVRAEKELIGPMGMKLDEKTVNRINGAVVLLNNNPNRTVIHFETRRGMFMSIPRANMIGLGVAIGEYIQACFEFVMGRTSQLKAISLENGLENALAQVAQIDVNSGWPSPVSM